MTHAPISINPDNSEFREPSRLPINPDMKLAEPFHLRSARYIVKGMCAQYGKDDTQMLAVLDIAAECFLRKTYNPTHQERKRRMRAEEELKTVQEYHERALKTVKQLKRENEKLTKQLAVRPVQPAAPNPESNTSKSFKKQLQEAKTENGQLRRRVEELSLGVDEDGYKRIHELQSECASLRHRIKQLQGEAPLTAVCPPSYKAITLPGGTRFRIDKALRRLQQTLVSDEQSAEEKVAELIERIDKLQHTIETGERQYEEAINNTDAA